MLTCISRSKQQQQQPQPSNDRDHPELQYHSRNHQIKSMTSQFKEIALKACAKHKNPTTTIDSSESPASGSDDRSTKWAPTYSRSNSARPWGKEMEARLRSISSREMNIIPQQQQQQRSLSRRAETNPPPPPRQVVFEEEIEPREWVAQVEASVLITFVSLVGGGNHLRRIRFSRDMYDKTKAQGWWTDNFDRVMELYNVQRLDRQAFPLQTPPRPENENVKMESAQETPATPPLNSERLPRTLFRPTGTGYSSPDSLEQHSLQSHQFGDSGFLTTTPKQSTISTAKTETSSVDASKTTYSSTRDDSESVCNASDIDSEWVEEDEPGVYITIKALANGTRELRRVRFSREKFGEVHARVWWEENRKRVHEQYL